MSTQTGTELVDLDLKDPIWGRFYTLHPLVVVGTLEEDGSADLAPKHLAMPMSWHNYFGFVCTPNHRTYQNIKRDGQFTVTFVRPSQVVLTSLSATPRSDDGSKPIVQALPTFPAQKIDGVFLQDGYLYLECELKQMVDELDGNSLIIGRIVGAKVAADSLRSTDEDGDSDQNLIKNTPLLAYLYPDRFAEITVSNKLPLPSGYKR